MLFLGSKAHQPFSRRGFIQVGASSVLGLSLGDQLQSRAYGSSPGSAKAVIMLWLWGGPSQLDTFDPKPNAPLEYRGPFGTIPTKIPGVRFCELFPKIASVSDRLSVIRSLHTTSNDHGIAGTIGLVDRGLDFFGQRFTQLFGGDGNDAFFSQGGREAFFGHDASGGGEGEIDGVTFQLIQEGISASLLLAGDQEVRAGHLVEFDSIENLTGTDFNDVLTGSNATANFNLKLHFAVLCRKIIIPSSPPNQPPKALNQINCASDTRSPARPARHLS